MSTTSNNEGGEKRPRAQALAILAYAWWGLVPAYWKQLPSFGSEELILYRVLLSLASLAPVIFWRRELAPVARLLRDPRSLAGCLVASALIGFNWYLYIWAIGHHRVVESSLGYFLNPLVNVALGTLLLKERMNRAQSAACALAGAGVALLAWRTHAFPWISVLLALSFGLYGFARKVLRYPTLAATFSETAVLAVPACAGLWILGSQGVLHVSGAPARELAWLALAGLVTTVPLLAFAEAAVHLPLTFMGFLQFLSPTAQFLLGVAVYGEPFGADRAAAFAVIWAGLIVFFADLAVRSGFAGRRNPAR